MTTYNYILSKPGDRVCRPKGRIRGKSGLHRAGCRVTPGQGDLKESATEINRLNGKTQRNFPMENFKVFSPEVRVERRGKSSPVPWRQGTLCKPHLEQHRDEDALAARQSSEVA